MTFDYSAARATAHRLLERFGGPMAAVRTSRLQGDDAFDPGQEVRDEFDGVGVLLNYDDRLIDDTMIKRGDRQAIFQPQDAGFQPRVNDRLRTARDVYHVVKVEDVNPPDGPTTNVIHIMQVRK